MLYLCEKQVTFNNVMKRLLAVYEISKEAGLKVEYRIPEPALRMLGLWIPKVGQIMGSAIF